MHPVGSPSPSFSTLTEALVALAQRFDLRQLRRQTGDDTTPAPVEVAAPAEVEVVERAFQCDLPRLDCIAALREGWARLSFAALGPEQAAVALAAVQAVPLPTGDGTGDDTPIVTASLWPAPMTALCGRRQTLAALGRQAGAPGVWEVASGALIDDTVPPGTVEVQFLANLELEFEPEPGAAEPGPVARTPVRVAVFDLCAGPRGSHGRVRAVAACWPWLEQLIETAGLGAAWRWTDAGMGAPPAQAAATATAVPPEDAGHGATPHGHGRTERLHALQAAYVALCRLYRDRGEPRRPRLADFADNQGLSIATMKRLLHDLGADWRRDFATLPLDAGESEPV